MKHVGILAHSAEGSALCYLAACHEGIRRLGPHQHPDITLDVIAMGKSMAAWEQFDLPSIRATLTQTLERLDAAGCDFFICPDNTAHLALEAGNTSLPLPGLHIAEVVADYALSRKFRSLGVLGTKWTMDGSIYRDAFDRRGLKFHIPGEADRELINATIFEELCGGIFREETKADYQRIIRDLARAGCDAVVLGCTEIPLLITPEASPLPVLDSTRLLAQAAVDVALGARAQPSWRGGKIRSVDVTA